MKELDTKDPKKHSRNIRSGLQEMVDHLRRDIHIVEDPRAKALFETSAEVLIGLQKAFSDFEEGEEEAWKQ